MLVWFYRPKNLISLVFCTFGIFVFFQVFVLVPNPEEGRKNDSSRLHRENAMDIEMKPLRRDNINYPDRNLARRAENKLNMLRQINLNVNEGQRKDAKYKKALLPIYDAQEGTKEDDDDYNVMDVLQHRAAQEPDVEKAEKENDEDMDINDDGKDKEKEEVGQDLQPRWLRNELEMRRQREGVQAPPDYVDRPGDLNAVPDFPKPPKFPDVHETYEEKDNSYLTNLLKEIRESPGGYKNSSLTIKFDKFSPNCTVKVNTKPNNTTPYKIYVLNLPTRFNADLLRCVDKVFYDKCFKTSHCGFGPEFYNENGDFSVRDSWQFALEVIMHHKLLLSPYRTFKIEEADAVYVPYYAAADCFCSQIASDFPKVDENVRALILEIRRQRPFTEKKYFMSLGKIEREHMTPRCPWLLQRIVAHDILYIGIEEEINRGINRINRGVAPPMIIAPYPSYGHLATNKGKKYIGSLYEKGRSVFLLLAAATRRSNPFRAKILDQFQQYFTNDKYEKFSMSQSSNGRNISMVHYSTPECRGDHNQHTIRWMRNSVFCLQPPGDSKTRKSIYDSIISGCIPVFIFEGSSPRLPFQKRLDYSKFTVSLPSHLAEEKGGIYNFLQKGYVGNAITELQANLDKVAKYFQYSYPVTNDQHDDAVKFLLEDLFHTIKNF